MMTQEALVLGPADAVWGLDEKVRALKVSGDDTMGQPSYNPLTAGDPDAVAAAVLSLLPSLDARSRAALEVAKDARVRSQLQLVVEAGFESLADFAFEGGVFGGYEEPDLFNPAMLIGFGHMDDRANGATLMVLASLSIHTLEGKLGAVSLEVVATYLPPGSAPPTVLSPWPEHQPEPEPLHEPCTVASVDPFDAEVLQGLPWSELPALLTARALALFDQVRAAGLSANLVPFRDTLVEAWRP